MKKALFFAQALVAAIPLVYLSTQWQTLPDRVPLHFNSKGVADGFGSKAELLTSLVVIYIVALGTSLLLNNLNRIDPKRSYSTPNNLIIKISWTVVIFLSVLMFFAMYSVANYSEGKIISSKVVVLCICLLFTVLGNFMNNIKPNYFVGIRTPWNLENAENWRKTHWLGSKLWFFGGLVLFILILVSPSSIHQYILFTGLVILCAVPFGYSYKLFANEKSGSSQNTG